MRMCGNKNPIGSNQILNRKSSLKILNWFLAIQFLRCFFYIDLFLSIRAISCVPPSIWNKIFNSYFGRFFLRVFNHRKDKKVWIFWAQKVSNLSYCCYPDFGGFLSFFLSFFCVYLFFLICKEPRPEWKEPASKCGFSRGAILVFSVLLRGHYRVLAYPVDRVNLFYFYFLFRWRRVSTHHHGRHCRSEPGTLHHGAKRKNAPSGGFTGTWSVPDPSGGHAGGGGGRLLIRKRNAHTSKKKKR